MKPSLKLLILLSSVYGASSAHAKTGPDITPTGTYTGSTVLESEFDAGGGLSPLAVTAPWHSSGGTLQGAQDVDIGYWDIGLMDSDSADQQLRVGQVLVTGTYAVPNGAHATFTATTETDGTAGKAYYTIDKATSAATVAQQVARLHLLKGKGSYEPGHYHARVEVLRYAK